MNAAPPPLLRPRRWLGFGAVLLGLLGAGVLFYQFDPARHTLFPPCLLHRLTGWDCPGCGAQRAAHQLLHGQVAAAFRLNPLLFLLAPLLLYSAGREAVRAATGRIWPSPLTRPWVGWLLLGLVLAFGLLRNLPGHPFSSRP